MQEREASLQDAAARMERRAADAEAARNAHELDHQKRSMSLALREQELAGEQRAVERRQQEVAGQEQRAARVGSSLGSMMQEM